MDIIKTLLVKTKKNKYIFEKMELDGSIVAVPIGESATDFHAVLNLNEEAMRILELLKEDTNEKEIVSKLLLEYEGTEEQISSLVHSFIEQLRQEDLLEE